MGYYELYFPVRKKPDWELPQVGRALASAITFFTKGGVSGEMYEELLLGFYDASEDCVRTAASKILDKRHTIEGGGWIGTQISVTNAPRLTLVQREGALSLTFTLADLQLVKVAVSVDDNLGQCRWQVAQMFAGIYAEYCDLSIASALLRSLVDLFTWQAVRETGFDDRDFSSVPLQVVDALRVSAHEAVIAQLSSSGNARPSIAEITGRAVDELFKRRTIEDLCQPAETRRVVS